MSAAQHTPGPWCVEDPLEPDLSIVQAGLQTYEWRFIAHCPGYETGEWKPGDLTRGEIEANARLIAAAPELIGSLQAALQDLERLYTMTPDGLIRAARLARLEAARAAVAKALGQ